MPSAVTFEHYEVMTREDGSLCELGRGAMGITYKGFDTRLCVPVALKVINTAHLHSDTARQRFVREARSAARLRHRNVASVFHLGQEGDNYFYAMEFIDGETVDALVKRQGALGPALALRIGAQVARALNAAQAHDLVHRDIKPANLMLVHEDDELVVKVIDFGLAKIALGGEEDGAASLTMSGFLGTPHFASPEQLEEREIDVRSDIYSLGITLWFALSGKTPFAGSVMQVMSQHITREPPFADLTALPEPVVGLLREMLAKDPAQRPQTAALLRKRIEQCLAQIGDAVQTPFAVEEGAAASEPEDTKFETGAAIGGRYLITEHLGESESGDVFRARDSRENRDVRLLALDRELLRDTDAIAQIGRDAAQLATLAHPNVLGVFGIEATGRASYLTFEWIDGFSLRDLLRARRELPPAEVLRLLPPAAAGIDTVVAANFARFDVALPQLFVHFPDCEIAPENLLRRTVDAWPEFVVKFNALAISRDRFALTWAGGQTLVGGSANAGAAADGRANAVRAFALVVYELLGGVPTAASVQRFTPLASIGEAGNEVLRRAILSPESFASVSEFATTFFAPPEIVVAPPPRTAADTAVIESPKTEVPIEPESLHEPEPLPTAAEMPVPLPIPAAPIIAASPTKWRPALIASGAIVLIAMGAGSYYARLRGTHRRHIAQTTPIVAKVSPLPTPTPIALPTPVLAKTTPAIEKPTLAKPEATPSSGAVRRDLANEARIAAAALEANGSTREALVAWIAATRDYPKFIAGRVGLESFVQRLRKRPGGVPREEFDTMRDEITQAAKLDVLPAMVLLGEQLQKSDPAASFAWYCAAAEKGDPVAMTNAGLMITNGDGTARNDEQAVYYLDQAAERKQPMAMAALAECYFSGLGVNKNDAHGMDLLKQAADFGDARAQTTLGVRLHKGLGATRDDREAFRLFTEAAERGNVDAVRNLGVLYDEGAGVSQSEKTAVEKFKEASLKGDALSMFYYARCLDIGHGAKRNAEEAKRWFKQSAEAGATEAAEWCKAHGVAFTLPKSQTADGSR